MANLHSDVDTITYVHRNNPDSRRTVSSPCLSFCTELHFALFFRGLPKNPKETAPRHFLGQDNRRQTALSPSGRRQGWDVAAPGPGDGWAMAPFLLPLCLHLHSVLFVFCTAKIRVSTRLKPSATICN